MDYRSLFTKEKLLPSLELEKQDIAYQVWELGRIYGQLTNSFMRIRLSLKEANANAAVSDLIDQVRSVFEDFCYLSDKLKQVKLTVIGDMSEFNKSIDDFLQASEGEWENELDGMMNVLNRWYIRICNQIRAKSIHLSNVFKCSHGLITLQAKLITDIHSEEIGEMVKATINDLEKLEKGDKVLTSPNLELSAQNLRIVKFRVEGIYKNLKFLRRLAEENADFYKERLMQRSEVIEYLILDIKNPSDYLSRPIKIYNNVIPFLISYYLVVIPIVIVQEYDLWLILSNDKMLLAILTGFVPLYLSFIVWAFRTIRNHLIVTSFKFKRSDFK